MLKSPLTILAQISYWEYDLQKLFPILSIVFSPSDSDFQKSTTVFKPDDTKYLFFPFCYYFWCQLYKDLHQYFLQNIIVLSLNYLAVLAGS